MPERQPLNDARLEALLAARFGVGPEAVGGLDDDPCEAMDDVARWMAGPVDPDTAQRARTHLATCASCRQAYEALSELVADGALPVRPRSTSADETTGDSGHGPARVARWSVLAAIAAGLLLFVVVPPPTPPQLNRPSGGLLAKGGADALQVAVQRGGEDFVARPGEPMRDGDRVSLFYSAREAGFLQVFLLDERGQATSLFPGSSTRPARLDPGVGIALRAGGTMRPGTPCEWFVAVFSDSRLPAADVTRRVREADRGGTSGCALDLAVPGARTVDVIGVRWDTDRP